ncbi:hypothetical protein AURDEDRAFT_123493 [Auricularia subglabra TFB-10046 SS5]|nr:hypothetical protein AURDEDRAFT_123493 [Auricularia subglabra TFB-10046 SS5]
MPRVGPDAEVTKQPNQYKPAPPDETILPIVTKYFNLRCKDEEILEYVQEAIDAQRYSFGLKSLKRFRARRGLLSTRQQKHTAETVAPFVAPIRTKFPTAGSREIIEILNREHGIRVSRHILNAYFKAVEPVAVAARYQNKLKRRRFWATGVNEVWAFDQHDKWKRFGLYLHLCVEVYTGKILWLKVWWTNRQPALLAEYYCDTVATVGGTCLITQSDPGREAHGIANAHTVIRQHLDPSLAGTVQHRWKRKDGMNVKPEICWSVMRRVFTAGFESLLDEGLVNGLYNPEDQLHMLAFRWLVIPWMQVELDEYRLRRNTRLPRKNKKKFLPHGKPDLIFERPDKYNAEDYKVTVPDELLGAIREQYAPSHHPVFQLVPVYVDVKARAVYQQLGSPHVSTDNLWPLFTHLAQGLREQLTEQELASVYAMTVDPQEPDDVPLLPGDGVPWPDEDAQASAASGPVPSGVADDDNGSDDDVTDEIPWAIFTDSEEDSGE